MAAAPGLKKHQPCRARHVRRASGSLRSRIYRRSQTVCFSRPEKGFHLFDVAWRDLQPTSKDRLPPVRLLHYVPASSPWPPFTGASQWGEQCKNFARPQKGRRRRRNRRSSESAPTCTAQPQGSFFF